MGVSGFGGGFGDSAFASGYRVSAGVGDLLRNCSIMWVSISSQKHDVTGSKQPASRDLGAKNPVGE